ncbi:MAG: aldo/keto reductase [Gammaproteobacteria bacterium]|nr:aldo/keto reductase [Gammaproteobacteria bacterium]
MQHRRLGNSGLLVSEVGLGCNNFGGRVDAARTQAVVDAALEQGINFFDTADVYGERQSETLLGKALGDRRGDVVIATKFGSPMGEGGLNRGGSRRYVRRAVEASLTRLGTDYIDLYQIHVPDAATPIAETLSVLDDLVREGKVRYVGHSNFSGWQIADAHWTARDLGCTAFVSAQNNYSLIERAVTHEVLPASVRFGLGVLPYFPLASGLLTGKYKRDEPAPQGTRLALVERLAKRALTSKNYDLVERLEDFARERDKSLLDLAFCWLLSQPVITSVIAGATLPEQVVANAAAADGWRLDRDEMTQVAEILKS